MYIQIIDGKLQLLGAYAIPLHLLALVILLLIATAVDVRERRIPNWLVVTGMVIGTAFHALAPQGEGIGFAFYGLIVGTVVLFPLYALHAMGAGDVKLMGMIGAFLGTTGILGVIFATMIAGGVLALGMAACKRMLPQLLANLHNMLFQRRGRQTGAAIVGTIAAVPSVGKMPYALAISVGTLIQLLVLRY